MLPLRRGHPWRHPCAGGQKEVREGLTHRPTTHGVMSGSERFNCIFDDHRIDIMLHCEQGTYVSLLGGIIRDRVKVSAYATVLRLSVCRRRLSSVMLCIVAKRYVLEQTLLLTAYRKSHMRNRLVPKQ